MSQVGGQRRFEILSRTDDLDSTGMSQWQIMLALVKLGHDFSKTAARSRIVRQADLRFVEDGSIEAHCARRAHVNICICQRTRKLSDVIEPDATGSAVANSPGFGNMNVCAFA